MRMFYLNPQQLRQVQIDLEAIKQLKPCSTAVEWTVRELLRIEYATDDSD